MDWKNIPFKGIQFGEHLSKADARQKKLRFFVVFVESLILQQWKVALPFHSNEREGF